ncbi:energy-coupling factor ABC transporter ATP-binding protein [Vibrio cholerae]|nr:energy-coupling factor ABC transporter ATP-binding protein [Vibrio cholerae]
MTIKLTAQQLSMRFKDRVLFHIPEIAIGPNDAIYLKGDNGVGKTTLLKILAGLLEPSNGRVLGSKPWWQRLFLTSATSEVVYLHQSPYLFDDTVYQNVVYGIRFSGLSAHEKRAQVITALRMVGLETLADEHISVLSGGEKQRVAMARAWILKPSILLMDEPSASLDQESIERLVIMARDLLERCSSLVITSHQTNALTALCKKQWWIKDRQLIESPLLQIVKENNDNHTNTSHASTFRH